MPTFTNTRTLLGDAGALDALVSDSLEVFADDIITEIGNYGFYQRKKMKTAYLPKVSRVGLYAFNECSNLQKVYVGLNQNAIIYLYNNNCFTNTGHCVIFVPDDLVTAYRTTSPWSTHADYIYGANDPDAPFWDETEIEDDAETIASYVNAGTAASRYNLGQYKTIDLGAQGQIRMQIVGKNMRELANSTQKAQLEWMAMDLLNTSHRFNPAHEEGTEGTGALGGYDKSELKQYIDTDIWALIPSTWQSIIKETQISSRTRNSASSANDDEITAAKLRIPSYNEIVSDYYEKTGPQYRFAVRNNADRIKKRPGYATADEWWLRTCASTYTNIINMATTGNANNSSPASTNNFICLAFST